MKRILVALETGESQLWPAVHAINLAKRMGGKVTVLRMLPTDKNEEHLSQQQRSQGPLQERLETLIEQARSQGVSVEYHIANGNYEDELVNFIREAKVDILVLAAPHLLRRGRRDRESSISSIRHRVNCRIELVYEKPETG
jgi:nucleotide-binding universal stress UspA family protein